MTLTFVSCVALLALGSCVQPYENISTEDKTPTAVDNNTDDNTDDNTSSDTDDDTETGETSACIAGAKPSINQLVAPQEYSVAQLAVGEAVYHDRSYTFTQVPAVLEGARYLVTGNNDKFSDATAQLISFVVDAPTDIYVAFDDLDTPVPAWLDAFDRTDDVLVDSSTSRALYRRTAADCSVVLYGNGGTGISSMYTVIVGGSAGVPSLVALDDAATVRSGGEVVIDVLANDLGSTGAAMLSLEVSVAAGNGTASVVDGVSGGQSTIRYVPGSGFSVSDSFTYKVTLEANGATQVDEATVTISEECVGCVDRTLTLKWAPSSDGGQVRGYRLYRDVDVPTPAARVATISLTGAGFDPSAPQHKLAAADLGLKVGETVCFTVTAYNYGGESGPSNSACLSL